MSKETKHMTFMNASEEPMIIEKGQVLGRATMLDGYAQIKQTPLNIDFADLCKPRNEHEETASREFGWSPPDVIDAGMLYDEADITEPAKVFAAAAYARSIPEDMVRELSKKADQWKKNDAFPNEDDPEITQIPTLPPISGVSTLSRDSFAVSPDLEESKSNKLRDLLYEMREAFTDGKSLGKVSGY